VEAEVGAQVSEGVKEINLISQDTTYFGMDRWVEKAGPRQRVDSGRGDTLTALLQRLETISSECWIRFLYTHPAHWSQDLMEAIAASSMRRETSREHIENLIATLREKIPGLTLRTTFIVGFPGETEAHFESLLEFIEAQRFERLGVFTYSPEEGSRAAKMPGQIRSATRQSRYRRAMALQQRIAAEQATAKIGRNLKVLVERPFSARTEGDAPEVDTRVILDSEGPVGEFATVQVTGTELYDLRGKLVPAGTVSK
jgi:ribosomal protein S12 methylthiotransferase